MTQKDSKTKMGSVISAALIITFASVLIGFLPLS